MTFRPKMTAFTDGIRALEALRWRAWDGVVADLWHAEGSLGGAGHYVSPDPRIVIFLGDGAQAIRLSDSPVEVALARPVALDGLPEIDQIAQLLATELQGDGLPDLYGEGLVQAIMGRVLA
ncbi:MAG: hypothetical protein ABIR04_08340 [Cypionkella sp.]